jgi:hypothetical protein
MPGVVPFQTTGFPEGAGSAKEAVMKQIASENQAQQNMNQTFGGAAKRKQSRRKQSSKRQRRSAKRSSAKHKRKQSRRKQSRRKQSRRKQSRRKQSRSKQSSKKRTYKKVIYRGGEGELESGKEVSVPQFGSTNNSGPLNPNALSAKLNEVSLAQYQGAIHDNEINNV